MTGHPLWRRALAEFLGTGLLVSVVVGSGIAAQRLSADTGLQLLENSIATALGLGVLILLLAPVSGAHFNPVVSLADTLINRRSRSGLSERNLSAYLPAQIVGGIAGAVLANAMFATPTAISTTDRATPATFLAEVIATAGLVLLIMGLSGAGRSAPVTATAVGAYIVAAYWFTSSTAFANPAVTIGRIFTDTFTGISPASAPLFLAAQFAGACLGIGLTLLLFPHVSPRSTNRWRDERSHRALGRRKAKGRLSGRVARPSDHPPLLGTSSRDARSAAVTRSTPPDPWKHWDRGASSSRYIVQFDRRVQSRV